MAGTGHPYEIANMAEVRKALEAFSALAGTEAGRAWFGSRMLLRYVTKPEFAPPLPRDALELLEECCDPDDLAHAAAKLAQGAEVRLFSRSLLDTSGADLMHVADWIASLSSREASKLARITPEAAVAKAATWITARKGGSGGAGQTAEAMRFDCGTRWLRLLDAQALADEGHAMTHCLFNSVFSTSLENGSGLFFSLRDANGKRLLTAHFIRQRHGPVLSQAKAAHNDPPTYAGRRFLLKLMDLIGACPSDAASHAGLALHEGQWHAATDLWDRVSWNGFETATNGRSMLVMSPRNPAASLAMVTLTGKGQGFISSLDARHYHIDEQRALARLMELLGTSQTDFGEGRPVFIRTDAGLLPFPDTLDDEEVGGVACMTATVRGEKVTYVAHSRDRARILLKAGRGDMVPEIRDPLSRYTTVAMPFEPARWKGAEAGRCLRVLSSLGAWQLGNGSDAATDAIRKTVDPVRTESGEWRSFAAEAVETPALTVEGKWKHTPFQARLAVARHYSATVYGTGDRTAAGLSAFLANQGMHREVAAFLNAQGWRPKPGGAAHLGSWSPSRFPAVYWMEGKWRCAGSLPDLTRVAARRLEREGRLTASEAGTVVAHMTGTEKTPASRRLLAAAICAWALDWRRNGKDRLPPFRTGTWGRPHEGPWHESEEGRLAVAATLRDLLPAAAADALGRIAGAVLETMLGRRRRGEIDFLNESRTRLLADWHGEMPARTFARALKRMQKGYSTLSSRYGTAPDPAWFGGLGRRAEAEGFKWMLQEAAERTLPSGNCTVEGPGDAEAWTCCAELAAGKRFRFLFADRLACLSKAIAAAEQKSRSPAAKERYRACLARIGELARAEDAQPDRLAA